MGKLEFEVEIKSPADKFWGAIKDSNTLFPKIFPEQFKSIDVIEGDGISVGSIRLLKYAEGIPIITFAKEKIEVADDTNKLITYSVIDGELANVYKRFKASLHVVPKGDDGNLVKWCVEFEKASEEVPDPNLIQEYAIKTFNGLDAYLLKA